MNSPATRMKHHASALKRAATTVRFTAHHNGLISDTERQTLISAACIMEAIVTSTTAAARTKAREEAAYEKAHNEALAKLKEHMKGIPIVTTGDKVRAALMTPYEYENKFLIKALDKQTLRELNWDLDFYAENGLNECARHHAYYIAKGNYDLNAAFEAIDKKVTDLRDSADALWLAQRFVDAIDKLKTATAREAA